jgi:phosphoribosylformimino-5-aminoimidazole carboxamide ribotide isomerase
LILIPVIDLLQERAVHARQGRRDRYRPLDSPLCRDGEVLPLVQRLVEEWGFGHLYLADLDAIQAQGDNRAVLHRILERFPGLQVWLDGGFRCPQDMLPLARHPSLRCVVGSESWDSPSPLPPGSLLSIDSDRTGPRDPSGICKDGERLPAELILMNLSRVGSHTGPDLDLLAHWRQAAPAARLYAAGGVRDIRDLAALDSAGASGVLLASALHAGHLLPSDLSA